MSALPSQFGRPRPERPRPEKRPWHLLGAALGLGLTLLGLGECPDTDATSHRKQARSEIIATINQHVVTRDNLESLLEGSGATGDADATQRALDFLIDRELMLQRAEEVGLVESDPTLRRALASALIATVEIPPLDAASDATTRRQAAELARQQLDTRRRAFIDRLRQHADIDDGADRPPGPSP